MGHRGRISTMEDMWLLQVDGQGDPALARNTDRNLYNGQNTQQKLNSRLPENGQKSSGIDDCHQERAAETQG